MKVRRTASVLLLASVCALHFVGDAICGDRKPPNEDVVGTWRLVSLYDEDDEGLEVESLGLNPKGLLIFDSTGHFSFQIVGDILWGVSPRQTARQLRLSGGPGVLAYFGRYAVSSDGVLHLQADWDGTDRVADLALMGDQLELISSTLPSPTGSTYSHLVWKRVR